MSGAGISLVVQARVGSTRLPGKVLLPLAGRPAIVRMMERLEGVRLATESVVATSVEAEDDAIVDACRRHGVPVVRGPLDDVLARVVGAVPPTCDVVVRLTADCPLVDPGLVDRHVEVFLREQPRAQYVSNAVVRTFPDGLDVEVVDVETLRRAHAEATSPYDREHVLPWARRRARVVPVTQEVDLSDLRWALDYEEDYRFIAEVYRDLLDGLTPFPTNDVYRLLLRRPDLIRLEGGAETDPEARADCLSRIERHLESADAARSFGPPPDQEEGST